MHLEPVAPDWNNQTHQTHGSHLELTETTAPGSCAMEIIPAGGVQNFRFPD